VVSGSKLDLVYFGAIKIKKFPVFFKITRKYKNKRIKTFIILNYRLFLLAQKPKIFAKPKT